MTCVIIDNDKFGVSKKLEEGLDYNFVISQLPTYVVSNSFLFSMSSLDLKVLTFEII